MWCAYRERGNYTNLHDAIRELGYFFRRLRDEAFYNECCSNECHKDLMEKYAKGADFCSKFQENEINIIQFCDEIVKLNLEDFFCEIQDNLPIYIRKKYGLLENLSLSFYQNINCLELESIWDVVPGEFKESLKDHLPCYEHYNRDYMRTHVDGPPSSKIRCQMCERLNNLYLFNNKK